MQLPTEEELEQIVEGLKASGANTPPDVLVFREFVCNACPDHVPEVKSCLKCECYLPLKLQIASATCPVGKWMDHKA